MIRYAIMTAGELAENLVGKLNLERLRKDDFIPCDFAIVDPAEGDSIEKIVDEAEGWYGIKYFNAGFDSEDLTLCADYYGGGCAQFAVIWKGEPAEDAANDLCRIIEDSLATQEIVKPDTKLLVDFNTEESKW